jgi:hypothetical protein
MAIITVPAKFSFTRVAKFGLLRATNVLRSRFTGQGQRIVYPFAVWQFEGTLVDYDGPEAAAIRSFFIQLEGQKNSFRLPVPGYDKPSTGYTNNAAVAVAAAARASSITMGGAGASIPFLGDGDYFTIQDELKMVTAPVALNAQGQAVVNFKPAMRKAAAINVGITLQKPTVLMHSTDDDVATWGLAAPVRHSLSLSAIEAVDI